MEHPQDRLLPVRAVKGALLEGENIYETSSGYQSCSTTKFAGWQHFAIKLLQICWNPPAASNPHHDQGGSMPQRMLKVLLTAGLCTALLPAVAFAKDHGKGHDRDKDRDHDRDKDRDHDRDNKRPPGWSKGKKTGWGNCNLPPGQAKKQGC